MYNHGNVIVSCSDISMNCDYMPINRQNMTLCKGYRTVLSVGLQKGPSTSIRTLPKWNWNKAFFIIILSNFLSQISIDRKRTKTLLQLLSAKWDSAAEKKKQWIMLWLQRATHGTVNLKKPINVVSCLSLSHTHTSPNPTTHHFLITSLLTYTHTLSLSLLNSSSTRARLSQLTDDDNKVTMSKFSVQISSI